MPCKYAAIRLCEWPPNKQALRLYGSVGRPWPPHHRKKSASGVWPSLNGMAQLIENPCSAKNSRLVVDHVACRIEAPRTAKDMEAHAGPMPPASRRCVRFVPIADILLLIRSPRQCGRSTADKQTSAPRLLCRDGPPCFTAPLQGTKKRRREPNVRCPEAPWSGRYPR